jgi:hypothetical protein
MLRCPDRASHARRRDVLVCGAELVIEEHLDLPVQELP